MAEHVPGRNVGHIMLYALSTCGWCKKTKELLDELGVEYYYEFVDQATGEKNKELRQAVEKWNPRCSFPTLVIDNQRCIIGFQEKEIRKLVR